MICLFIHMNNYSSSLSNLESTDHRLQRRKLGLRASLAVDDDLKELESLLKGVTPKLQMDESEKRDLLSLENEWALQLEEAFDIKTRSITLSTDYFWTEAGVVDLEKLFPGSPKPQTKQEMNELFYRRQSILATMDEQELDKISEVAAAYADNKLEESVFRGLDSQGFLNLDSIEYPASVALMLNPGLAVKKLDLLMNLRKKVKTTLGSRDKTNLDEAKKILAQIYLPRINEMISGLAEFTLRIFKKRDALGEESLSSDEKQLLSRAVGGKNPVRARGLHDKFVFGVSPEKTDKGDYVQIGKAINAKLSVVLDAREGADVSINQALLAKGLDPDKVRASNILPEQRGVWAKRILAAYGVLSEESGDDYVSGQGHPAKDGKWRFVSRKDRKTKAINFKQKVVLDSAVTQDDIIKALVVLCGHEIEGHVVQQINKEKIPLRIFQKVGGDRRHLLSEGGAVYNEQTLLKDLFGYDRLVKPTYLLAMEARKKGGDYAECLLMAYGVIISELRSAYDLNDAKDFERFTKEVKKSLKMLISSVRRVFSGVAFSDKTGILPNTKDTVYTEQEILMEKLNERGMTKLAFVGGMNIRNITALIKLGLLDFDQIETPKYVTRDIWNEIKSDYKLD